MKILLFLFLINLYVFNVFGLDLSNYVDILKEKNVDGLIGLSIEAKLGSYANLVTEKNIEKDINYGVTTDTLDVYYDKENTSELKPVVIFIHGGAWISDNKNQYSKIGSLLLKENYIAVIPNYVLFPKGSIDDMVDDVYYAIKWTYENIEKYGGDINNVILSGHSAGAHLSLLTTLKAKLQVENNGKILPPLPKFQKLVLYNGPYDFDDYDPLKLFTDSDINGGISESLVKLLVKNENISPTDILRKLEDNSIEDLGAGIITLFVADKDQIIPFSSGEHLSEQIRRVSPSTTLNYVINEGNEFDHLTLVFGAMADQEDKEQLFMELIKM